MPTPRRVRAYLNHTAIVDTTKALHVWEHAFYPQFYVPFTELRNCTTKDKKKIDKDGKLVAAVIEITVPGQNGLEELKTDRAVRFENDPVAGSLAGMVRLEFGSMSMCLPVPFERYTGWLMLL